MRSLVNGVRVANRFAVSFVELVEASIEFSNVFDVAISNLTCYRTAYSTSEQTRSTLSFFFFFF